MIFYSPISGDILTDPYPLCPRSCFLMTQLGGVVSQDLLDIRESLNRELDKRNIKIIDASSTIKSGDYLEKIWKQILSVPFGIAIVTEDMKQSTVSNIFYELGILDSLGKYSIIIKSKGFKVPSDMVRTEYITFDEKFSSSINKYLDTLFEQAEHYFNMGEEFTESKPLISIDYFRRAFVITDDIECIHAAKLVYENHKGHIDEHHRIFINKFLKHSNISKFL